MPDTIAQALEQLRGDVFVMTSAFEDQRAGIVVLSVFQCAAEPPLICAAVRKGHPIEPLIRDSHCFALCRVDPSQKLVLKKFAVDPTEDEDPFDSFTLTRLTSHAPILAQSTLALDCEVVRHFDLEADHELFVGQVLAARLGAGSA